MHDSDLSLHSFFFRTCQQLREFELTMEIVNSITSWRVLVYLLSIMFNEWVLIWASRAEMYSKLVVVIGIVHKYTRIVIKYNIQMQASLNRYFLYKYIWLYIGLFSFSVSYRFRSRALCHSRVRVLFASIHSSSVSMAHGVSGTTTVDVIVQQFVMWFVTI